MNFLKTYLGASWKILGSFLSVLEAFYTSGNNPRSILGSHFFWHFWMLFGWTWCYSRWMLQYFRSIRAGITNYPCGIVQFTKIHRSHPGLLKERLYESSRAVNKGWRFTARTKWDFSKSVNSFDTGPIFPARLGLGYQLSRNVGLMSIYALLKNPSWRIGLVMLPKNDGNFRESVVCEA